jgi:hypothetical protein
LPSRVHALLEEAKTIAGEDTPMVTRWLDDNKVENYGDRTELESRDGGLIMHAIFKYPFDVADDVRLEVPKGARILTVQEQAGRACAWALVDPGAPISSKDLLIRGTGQPVDAEELGEYLCTFQMHGGRLVFHVFVPED